MYDIMTSEQVNNIWSSLVGKIFKDSYFRVTYISGLPEFKNKHT